MTETDGSADRDPARDGPRRRKWVRTRDGHAGGGSQAYRAPTWWRMVTCHLERRIVRYAIVGLLGIPVNNVALALFLLVTGGIYWLALVLAFEVSTTVNFVANQKYTYREQTHLRGWDWPRRAVRAQASSLSALVVAIGVALPLKYGLHFDNFIATDTGILVAFLYNFAMSRRFVFRDVGI